MELLITAAVPCVGERENIRESRKRLHVARRDEM
jgi:hypothetical protein